MTARRLLFAAALGALALLPWLALSARAQNPPRRGGIVPLCADCYGPSPVSVTPSNGTDTVPADGVLDSVAFTVRNIGTQYIDTYTLTRACTNVTCQAKRNPNPAGPLTLSPGAAQTVYVKFYHPSAPGSGTVSLTAADTSDYAATGTWNIISPAPPVTPTGPLVARELCLTIAAGAAAAYECGELRVVHPLPAVRTLETVRTPTLLYNSQHAHPFPALNGDVTLAANDRPDSVIAIARVNAGGGFVQRDREAWAGSQWGPAGQASTRRIMTTFGAGDLATGLYPYQLEIDRWVAGVGYTAIRTDTGTVAIINRLTSSFGAGWWLAGFEQLLFPPDGAITWIGGDGSVRRYLNAGSWSGKTWYVTRSIDRPDTLSFDGATYVRYLRGGGKVLFNSTGFHIQTVNRLGYATVFAPDGSNRLSSVTVPPSGAGLVYTFIYGGANGRLSSVTAPDTSGGSGRVTAIATEALSGGARVAAITDPGAAASVQFAYGHGSYPAAITARTNRRGATTSYTLGPGLRLIGTSLPVPGAQTITRTFCPAEIRAWACGTGLTSPESTYTVYDGPRIDSADVTHFWLDSLGAVTRIRDAYNNVTTIARIDARWPELPTRTQAPNGRIMRASYDARGNLAAVLDSNPYNNGQNPTTQYVWDQRWDGLTLVTLPNGQITRFNLDATNGNLNYLEDARGSVARTTFTYVPSGNGAGLLFTVTAPGGATTTLAYDAQGNVDTSRAPLGWTTSVVSDRLGRPRVTRTPLGPLPSSNAYRTDSTAYDARDRVIRTAVVGDSVPGVPRQAVTAYSSYDDEGNRYQVQRLQSPDPTFLGWLTTQWTFDAAHRPTVEIAPDGYRDSTWYDPAGNVTSTKTRRGHGIAMTYDRMNRLRQRVVPAVTYPQRTGPGYFQWLTLSYDGYSSGIHPYPWFPNAGNGGLRIDSLIDTFAYDSVGNLVLADNADARVRRTYFKDGSLQTDSLWIRNYSNSTFGHVYGLRYTYDANGRPTALRHPSQLATGAGMRDSVRYVYNDTTGALAQVYTLLGNQIQFLYNARGELIRTSFPGGITDSLAYDSLGRVTLDRIWNQSSSPYKAIDSFLRNTVLSYADPVRVSAAINDHGWMDTVTASYSGLGHLALLTYARPQNTADSSLYVMWRQSASQNATFDPLGNAYSTYASSAGDIGWGSAFSGGSTGSSHYESATARADSTTDAGGQHAFVYDSAGNTVFFYQVWAGGGTVNDRASFYGADGRLRVAEWREAWSNNGNWTNPKWQVVFEEYRYDALGRRVLVMSRQGCWLWAADSTTFSDCQVSRVRRTVWDGARELWEIQMPARAQDSLLVENDTAAVTYWAGWNHVPVWSDPNPLFGRVAYTYAGGVDQPVSLTRVKLVRRKSDTDIAYFSPVELRPHWNWRGGAEIGTFADGGMRACTDGAHCVAVQWRGVAFAVGLASELLWEPPWGHTPYGWFGTLINDKVDGTGTHSRRNRYVDPATGRFTQEDPIGLAGGLNLYGFASGDPVNLSDPFGLLADTITYNVRGAEISRVQAPGEDVHFLRYRGETFRLDYGLVEGSAPYELHSDLSDTYGTAQSLATSAAVYTDRGTIGWQSRPGGDLDFKRLLPDRALWNIGGGAFAHKHAVGNMAWGNYMARRGFSLQESLRGARFQGWTAGGEDPLDQRMIVRGFRLFGR